MDGQTEERMDRQEDKANKN